MIQAAREFAKMKHGNQLDDCGKVYFESHIEHVVSILKQITDDEDILACAYLHDVLEDTDTSLDELIEVFGGYIASVVHELTHEGDKRNGYYFPRLSSHEAIMIKFADRLSNLSRMDAWSAERQEHYLKRSKFWKNENYEVREKSNGGLLQDICPKCNSSHTRISMDLSKSENTLICRKCDYEFKRKE